MKFLSSIISDMCERDTSHYWSKITAGLGGFVFKYHEDCLKVKEWEGGIKKKSDKNSFSEFFFLRMKLVTVFSRAFIINLSRT